MAVYDKKHECLHVSSSVNRWAAPSSLSLHENELKPEVSERSGGSVTNSTGLTLNVSQAGVPSGSTY